VRTLVISDLHLGNRAGHDVLRRPAALAVLLKALDDVDRLVLLGDLAELMTRNPRRPLAVAEPVVRALGRRMGPDREVVLVPGNHDGPLVKSWARAEGASLAVDTLVEPGTTRALSRVVSWLSPARVRVHYPGVWLDDRIWATHGHYLDHHLFPESAFGILRGRSDGVAGAPPMAYERTGGGRRTGGDSFLAHMIQRPGTSLLEGSVLAIRSAALPAVPVLLKNARMTPVTAAVIDLQMRRASIPAMARVVRRLGVDADWVIFGHVHRAGPLAGDSQKQWEGPGGRPRFLNTGAWLYEPLLVDRSTPPHPYWPGHAVVLEPGSDPQVVGLLDGLTADELLARERAVTPG
jgi:UDP-2,3-diacylglucosamine pyrophosphatase LpxH